MPATSDLLVLALIVLVSVAVAGRAYFAWLWLTEMSAVLRSRSERLEQIAVAASPIAGARSVLTDVNVALERQLSELPRRDQRLADAGERLRTQRTELEEFRTRRLVAAEDLLGQARRAWRVVQLATNLRRSLPI